MSDHECNKEADLAYIKSGQEHLKKALAELKVSNADHFKKLYDLLDGPEGAVAQTQVNKKSIKWLWVYGCAVTGGLWTAMGVIIYKVFGIKI